jgi:uncharacterized protein (DUF1501 family)
MELPHPPLNRRDLLKWTGASALGWLTPLGHLLAREAERAKGKEPAQSVIILWLDGGASQLETFDPHPNTEAAGGTTAIPTAVKGIELARGYEQLADQMADVSLIRSLVSLEGDHERGTYTLKTGYRPQATVLHPSLGAICCHETSAAGTDVPRHVSILHSNWPARGGFLGDEFDAFKMDDPAHPLPDVTDPVAEPARVAQRLSDWEVVEKAFARGRENRVEATQHAAAVKRARAMMTSQQLRAFDVSKEPAAVRKEYGDTPFGRGCLAARRLIEVGVRCVEVNLSGWDTHAENHSLHTRQAAILDPAFAALLRDLRQRDLLRKTVVVCMSEFGRTPSINKLGGRDHWPEGFSVALAGGGIRGGRVVGATDPEGDKKKLVRPTPVHDVHATVLTALGIDPKQTMISKGERPIKLSAGEPIADLLG